MSINNITLESMLPHNISYSIHDIRNMYMKLLAKSLLNPIAEDNKCHRKSPGRHIRYSAFSPDGFCYYSATNDGAISLYATDERAFGNCNDLLNHTFIDNTYKGIKEHIDNEIVISPEPWVNITIKEDIRDICWFPNFNWNYPDSCCLLVASRNMPIHLYDAPTGTRHLAYKPMDSKDTLAPIYSLDFHPLGKYFVSGGNGCVYIFDIENPGEQLELRRFGTRKNKGQSGIISAITHNSFGSNNMYACGSYNASISLYDHNESRIASFLNDFMDPLYPIGPVTMLKWFNEHILLVGTRCDTYIRSFDIRGDVSKPLLRFKRHVRNHQKLSFDIADMKLFTGTFTVGMIQYKL
ncbi:bifunctional WD40-YVTN repeat-like-containing domain superfamily/WD40 repeat/WD40-repeat-containing domain superfamily [Babesia duncani]|uniref:Bifunctional WD40-YVTN repeat-like-containing domain superfamily/WD40 repeat/WD40-repeat-containing domain superfamily n=1 Tax=Babesia duncani TaxID=323732 RepID=A0AAD9PI21_9APIC|nr:bifunctional WD40-YVTN repeat-like-containing domain superfamily/WD40 repeat/WD40-repeat-containing domain superfamily [Babesia duncani]